MGGNGGHKIKIIPVRIGMDKKLEAAIAKNLLEDKTCENCNNKYTCSIKLGKKFNTCRKWKEYKDEIQFNIKSYSFKVKPQKLNVTWSQQTEDLFLDMKEDDNYSVYKHLYGWKANIDALRELNDGKFCGNCLYREECPDKEKGICNKHEIRDLESLLIKQVSEELKKEIDKQVGKNE